MPVVLEGDPNEQTSNWTCTALLIPRSSCKIFFKSFNILSFHKLNEQNVVDADKLKDYNEDIMIPKCLVKGFIMIKIPEESNLE